MSDALTLGLAVVAVITGQTLLKLGMQRVGRVDRASLERPLLLGGRVVREPRVLAGLALYALSGVTWVVVLARSELSYAFPFLGLTYVGVVGVAAFLLRERVVMRQWLGVALIVVGVSLVALSKGA